MMTFGKFLGLRRIGICGTNPDPIDKGGHNYRSYYTGDQGSTPVVLQSEYYYEPIMPIKTSMMRWRFFYYVLLAGKSLEKSI